MSADFRAWSDFFWPGTQVLRNKLGLRDPEALEQAERALTLGRLLQLRTTQAVQGGFDLTHLQAIHAFVFQDVYEWAGQLRTVTLTKGHDEFCRPEHIASYAEEVFGRLVTNDLLRDLDEEAFIREAAEVLGDINALHAFRDGNGRSQRVFLELLADAAGHPIRWPADMEARNISASIASLRGDNSGLRELIAEGVRVPGRPPADHDPAPATDPT